MGKNRKPWSAYWMGDALTRFENAASDAEKMMTLSNIRRGIANFVNILTGTDIPVKFNAGQMSLTDGHSVVILSAQNEPEKFDAQVGRALHEATHVIRSQAVFAWLRHFNKHPEKYLDDDIIDAGKALSRTTAKMQDDFQLIVNFLEDRRNDLWGFRTAPGYRPYYEAHYSQSFYSPLIDELLQHPLSRIPALKMWELHLLNMFSPMADPDALPGLRKVWEIIDLPNIDRYDNDDTRWYPWAEAGRLDPKNGTVVQCPPGTPIHDDDLPLMIRDAREILRIIYHNSVLIQVCSCPDDMKGDSEMNEFGEDSDPNEDFSDLENYDSGGRPDSDEDEKKSKSKSKSKSGKGEDEDGEDEDGEDGDEGKDEESDKGINVGKAKRPITPKDMEKVKKALRRQKNETKGQTPKAALSQDEADTLNHLESSDAEMREVSDEDFGDVKCKVIVYRHVTEDTLKIKDLGFSSFYGGTLQVCPSSVKAVEQGKILGNLLAHRIRIMNDEGTVRLNRQKQGRFDKRMAASIPCDVDTLFYKSHTAQIEPVMVDLSIDASGSMSGEKWEKAMTLSIALAVAAAKIRTFRIRINVRASWGDVANVGVVYDSKRDNVKKIDTLFKFLHPNGGTPEGLCYDAMSKELLEEIKQVRRFFVNLSDGEPCFSFGNRTVGGYRYGGNYVSYSGPSACRHTKKQVDKMRNMGVRILSFFICDSYMNVKDMGSGYHNQFQTMYGKDAAYINPKDVTEIAFSLNKLFLKE